MLARDASDIIFLAEPYLIGTEKLIILALSKEYNAILRAKQNPIYENKLSFFIAVSQYFTKRKFNMAWNVYQTTVNLSKGSAIFYKLRDKKNLHNEFKKFAPNETLEKNGRIYNPGQLHNWDMNQVWLLSHFHIKNDFRLFTQLTKDNIKRHNDQNSYSALAKEIATAIKANYKIDIDDSGRIIFYPDKLANTSFKFSELKVSDLEIQSAVELIMDYQKSIKGIQNLIKNYKEIDEMDQDDLVDFEDEFKEEIDQYVDQIYSSKNASILLKYLNDQFTQSENILIKDWNLISCDELKNIFYGLFENKIKDCISCNLKYPLNY